MCTPVTEEVQLCTTCAGDILQAITTPYALENGAALIKYITQRNPHFTLQELRHCVIRIATMEHDGRLPGDQVEPEAVVKEA